MKKITVLLLIITFISCKKDQPILANNEKMAANIYTDLYGNWVGEFIAKEHDSTDNYVYSNKINLVIKKIENDEAFGQSIVAGNKTPLKGQFKKENDEYQFVLNEPGTTTTDGTFEFAIKNGKLIGTWKSNDKKQHVTLRTFTLKKQEFKYNPKLMLPAEGDYVDYYSQKIDSTKEVIDDVEETFYDETYRVASDIITKLNSSTTLLKESDIKNLKKLELEILRNTIYARHGYTFKKKSFRQFFDPVEWYIPVSDDVTKELTPFEKVNIKLLERFEKYAEDNYDTFGR